MSLFGGARIGIASSYGLSARDIELAYERGARFFFYGALRRPGFARGVRRLTASRRGDLTLALQSYTRVPSMMEGGVRRGLRSLGTDHADVLVLSWWTDAPFEPIFDEAVRLRERGLVRNIFVSSHQRPTLARLAEDTRVDGLMVRYNAAHPGAETELFPFVDRAAARRPTNGPAVLAFNATRWGSLLGPVRASDCYRFTLSHPSVDACLVGPSGREELLEALVAAERGPLSDEEMAQMRAHGAAVRARFAGKGGATGSLIGVFDRLARCFNATPPAPKLLP